MIKKWARSHPLLTAIGIFMVVFLILTLGNLMVWLILRALGLALNLVSIISSFSSLVTTAAVFSAAYLAYGELAELSQGRHLEVADRLFDVLNSEESIAARRWIYQNLGNSLDYGKQDAFKNSQKYIKHTLNSLDRVAFITRFGYVSDDDIMPWMHPMVIKVWAKLKPFVLSERKRRGEPLYYKEAEKLAERTIAWCHKHNIPVEVTWIEDAL
jgi:hypothetical protein